VPASPPHPGRLTDREAPVSTQHAEAEEEARVPCPDAHAGWSRCPSGPSPEGPGTAQRLSLWRVRDRATFAEFRGGVRRRRGPLTVVRLPPRDGAAAPPRVAFAIGRRVGSAVTRNRVRRRLRAALASHASLLTPGAAYLVGAGQQAASWDYATLESALGDLLAEAHSENLR